MAMETNRIQRIEYFLNYLRDIAEQNPNYYFTKDSVYHELTRYGIPHELSAFSFEPFFQKWINHFQKASNIQVFVDPKWSYFCQFKNNVDVNTGEIDHIMTYIPLDPSHMEKGVNMIFEFLSKKKIRHLSKVGKGIRFDSVVVRLTNAKDAEQLMTFIQSNAYIQEGLYQANPFAINNGGIAFACDGRISYNTTVANYISLYINMRKTENRLNNVGYYDFYNFVREYSNRAFSSREGINRLIRDFNIRDTSAKGIVNYQNVTSLIIKAGNPSFSFKDYLEHYKICSDSKQIEQQVAHISNVITANDVNELNQVETLFMSALRTMEQKYGFERAKSNLIGYLSNGNTNLLTRENNIRNNAIQINLRDKISTIINQKNISIETYIEMISADRTISLDINDLANKALKVMVPKYGFEQAIIQLNEYLKTNNPLYITSTDGLRDLLTQSNFREQLISTLASRNIDLGSYLNELLIQVQDYEDPTISINNAIMANYSKYEREYRDGKSDINGRDAAHYALAQLFKTGSYNGFTRENNGRSGLMRLSKDKIVSAIRKVLKYPDQNHPLTEQEIELLSDQYSNMVIDNNISKQYY